MRAAVAGLLVGAGAAGALAATHHPSSPHAPTATGANDAARVDFLDAWRRSRLSTWFVVLRFERRTAAGRHLSSEVRIAQRPPDRLSTGLGSIDARRDGRRLACATGADDRLRCRDGGPAPPYAQEVDDEMALLGGYLSGPDPLYRVTAQGGGCYQLDLRVSLPAPPYGRRARFCFDRSTGAPVASEVDRAEATDRQQAVEVRATVGDGDLAPAAGEPG